MGNARRTLDVAAVDFVKYCNEYLTSQQAQLLDEISRGASAELLKDRAARLQGASNIIAAVTIIRFDNVKGQLYKDIHSIEAGIQAFDALEKTVEAVRSSSRQETNVRQLTGVLETAKKYRQAMVEFLDNSKGLTALAAKRLEASDAVQEAARETAQAGMMARSSSMAVVWMVDSPDQILKPLYSGGLWLAVTMTPARRPSALTA